MASFRKPSSKTRAALESSTALPPGSADVLSHVGDVAAKLADTGRTGRGKPARKPGSRPTPVVEAPALHASGNDADGHASAQPEDQGLGLLAPAILSGTTDPGVEGRAPMEAAQTEAASTAPMTAIADTVTQLADAVEETGAAVIEPVPATVDAVEDRAAVVPERPASRAPEPSWSGPAEVFGRTDRAPPNRASHVLVEMQGKLADFVQDYLEDTLDLMTEMASARTVPDLLMLQSRHVQRRLRIFASQSRDLSALASSFAFKALSPL